MGRLSTPAAAARDGGEMNVARAMCEQDNTRECIDMLKHLYAQLAPQLRTFPVEVQMEAGRSFRELHRGLQEQLEMDCEDESDGRVLNENINVLIKRQEPLRKAALTQTLKA
jgi:hypothetical protein